MGWPWADVGDERGIIFIGNGVKNPTYNSKTKQKRFVRLPFNVVFFWEKKFGFHSRKVWKSAAEIVGGSREAKFLRKIVVFSFKNVL